MASRAQFGNSLFACQPETVDKVRVILAAFLLDRRYSGINNTCNAGALASGTVSLV